MKSMSKKLSYLLIVLVLLAVGSGSFWLKTRGGAIQLEEADVHFFYMPGCPHCAEEEIFLSGLEEQYPELKIARLNVFNKEAVKLLEQLYEKYDVPVFLQDRTPTTFTRERYFVGFNSQVGEALKGCIEDCLSVQSGEKADLDSTEAIALPLIGKIEVEKYSLPALAVVLGLFDGFNVCSLGALVLILSLVLVLRNRKKVFLFGFLFVFTTAVIYGLLIVIWHQVFNFLVSFINFFEILIGLLGVGGGVYFLREFIRFRKKGAACEIESGKGIMSKFSAKMQKAFESGAGLLAIGLSILSFAFIITIVEFPCSAAVPLFFAGVLSEAEASAV